MLLTVFHQQLSPHWACTHRAQSNRCRVGARSLRFLRVFLVIFLGPFLTLKPCRSVPPTCPLKTVLSRRAPSCSAFPTLALLPTQHSSPSPGPAALSLGPTAAPNTPQPHGEGLLLPPCCGTGLPKPCSPPAAPLCNPDGTHVGVTGPVALPLSQAVLPSDRGPDKSRMRGEKQLRRVSQC